MPAQTQERFLEIAYMIIRRDSHDLLRVRERGSLGFRAYPYAPKPKSLNPAP